MNGETETDTQWQALDFLAEFAVDLETGQRRPLRHYLDRYPRFEQVVAQEWLAATGTRHDDPGNDPRPAGVGGESQRLGHYRICEEIGRGGQGIVYRAVDTRLGREVALKVLRRLDPGTDAANKVPGRFLREAMVTGRLQHPGICEIYEADEHDGQLFIAMRHVVGRSLARLLEEARATAEAGGELLAGLGGVSGVLSMVEQLARAVDAAHRAGVVHRDLKPANVMVQESGAPVLLDFGLARDADSTMLGLTATGEVFGTPPYMSPEQLDPRGVVDQRTDVWSLGVLLYECLTLQRPFQAATREALSAAIRELPPAPARRLNPELPADLLAVLEVVLDKDPTRRFQSAAALAEDLQRVRTGQPILARPPGPLRRALRWVQRNRGLAAALLALFFILVGAVIFSEVQRHREARLRQTAVRRSLELRELARSLLVELHGAVADIPGATLANQKIVRKALDFLQLLTPGQRDDDVVDPELAADLVLAHIEVGDALGNPHGANLGRADEARQHYRDAMLIAQAADHRYPGRPRLRRLLAECHLRQGEMLDLTYEPATALQAYQQGLDVLRPVAAQARPQVEDVLIEARLRLRRATGLLHLSGRGSGPNPAIEQLAAAMRRLEEVGTGIDVAMMRAVVSQSMAEIFRELADRDAARRHVDVVQQHLQSMTAEDRARTSSRLLRARSEQIVAWLEIRQNKLEPATARLQSARDQLVELWAIDPRNEQVARLLISARRSLADTFVQGERMQAAFDEMRQAVEVARQAAQRFHAGWAEEQSISGLLQQGELHYEQRQFDAAHEQYELAHAMARKRFDSRPDDVRCRDWLARSLVCLGSVHVRTQRLETGDAFLRQALRHYEALAATMSPRDPNVRAFVVARKVALQMRADVAFQRGQLSQAEALYRQAVAVHREAEWSDTPAADRSLGVLLQGLGELLYQQRSFDEALQLAKESTALFDRLAKMSEADRFSRRLLALCRINAARALRRLGRIEEALVEAGLAVQAAESLAKRPDAANNKLTLTRVRAWLLQALVQLESQKSNAARDSLQRANKVLLELPGGEDGLSETYRSVLQRLRRQLGE